MTKASGRLDTLTSRPHGGPGGLTWPWLLAWLGYFVVVVGGGVVADCEAIRQRHLQH